MTLPSVGIAPKRRRPQAAVVRLLMSMSRWVDGEANTIVRSGPPTPAAPAAAGIGTLHAALRLRQYPSASPAGRRSSFAP